MTEISRRRLEVFLLFICVPIVLAILRWKIGIHLSFFAAIFVAVAPILLLRDPAFDRRNLFRMEALRSGWKNVVGRFLVLATILGIVVAILKPAPLFAF